jgi:hypothetical protein
MPDTQEIKKEGWEYAQLIIPVVIALVATYLLFPPYDDARIINNENILNGRLDNLTAEKASITQFDSDFASIRSNMSNFSSTHIFFEGKLQDFLNRLIPIEQNTSTNLISIAGLNQHLTSTDGNLTSFFNALSSANASYAANFTLINGSIADLQEQITLFRNSTCGNYTAILEWATSLDINMTALNNSVQAAMNQQSAILGNQTLINGNQTVILNRLDVFNATLQKICANLTGVC